MARENTGWGYDRMVGALANLGWYHQTSGSRVDGADRPQRHPGPCRYVPHDRLSRLIPRNHQGKGNQLLFPEATINPNSAAVASSIATGWEVY
jgi:hypothetical protein